MPRRKTEPDDPPIDYPERGPATTTAAIPPRVKVDVDTLITRIDLGPNAVTLVHAGDNVPVHLESYPRNPA